MSGCLRALSGSSVVATEQVQQVGSLQFSRFISLALFINQERELDARLLAKLACVGGIAHADNCQPRSFRPEFLFVLAQLRDMLAAEDSTVVAQEDHDRGPVRPQRA